MNSCLALSFKKLWIQQLLTLHLWFEPNLLTFKNNSCPSCYQPYQHWNCNVCKLIFQCLYLSHYLSYTANVCLKIKKKMLKFIRKFIQFCYCSFKITKNRCYFNTRWRAEVENLNFTVGTCLTPNSNNISKNKNYPNFAYK